MTQRITFIYIESTEPLKTNWLIYNAEGELEKAEIQTDLSNFPATEKNNKTIVIVPSEDILLTVAELPKLNRHRLMQALPFALEEQLIEDVALLHFAIAKQESDGTVPTAIVSKQKMGEWLSLLDQFDIHPNKLIPSVFATPFTEKEWHIIDHHHVYTIRTGMYEGFACDKVNAPVLMETCLTRTTHKPETIHLYLNAEETSPPITLIGLPVRTSMLTEKKLLEHLFVWATTNPVINLLQGTYQPKRKSAKTKKLWLIASTLAAAWIVISFTNLFVSYVILRHQSQQLEASINMVYRQQFPHATSIVAPRERLTRKLNQLTGQSNHNYFLALLADTGKILSQQPTIQITRFDFREDKLSLTVTAPTFDQLDAFTNALSSERLHVKQQSAAAENAKINATLIIRRG